MNDKLEKYINENPNKKFIFLTNAFLIDNDSFKESFSPENAEFIISSNPRYFDENISLEIIKNFKVNTFEGEFKEFVSVFENKKNFYIQDDLRDSLLSKSKLDIFKNSLFEKISCEFSIKGTVQFGAQIARKMNFPTANLITPYKSYIETGVYFTKIKYKEKIYNGVTCVRTQGLFRIVESHLLDFNQDIYNEYIETKFIKKIRENKKCKSLEEVKKLILLDIEEIRKLEKEYGN